MVIQQRGVAIVTGAGQGIGLGIAQALSGAGLKVALADLDGDAARSEAARLQNAEGYALDVADADGWERIVAAVVERFGALDVLVNNAGISPRGTAESTDDALWEKTLATNLKGPWLGIKAALPHLKSRRGTIINIGSTHSTLPLRNLFAYCVSKAGLLGLTRQVALDYLHEGVRCNMIAPGWVASPGERRIQAAAGKPDFPAGIRNISTAADVGAAVVYLVSDAARNVTGATIHLDGGLHAFGDVRWVHHADAP